jgi:multiple sugar transport system permease protein
MNRTRPPLQSLAIYAGAVLILVWSAGPFIWQFSTSFQLDKMLTSGSPSLIPHPFTLEHYYNAFVEKELHRYVWNSLVVSLATTFLCLFVGSLAAFALSRLNVKGRFGILMVILSVSMFPQIALVGPLYLVATNLGLLDTYTALIITYLALGLPLVTWVLFGYFETLPREIDEAARMDGCGPWRIYWRIMLPLSLPVMATAAIFSFIWTYDNFLGPLIYLNDINLYTVPLALRAFVDSSGLSAWGQLFAMSTLSLVPLFVFFLFFQRLIIRGVATSAMKR